MDDFEYSAASTVDDAVQLLSARGEGARVLAGGTDILVHLREGRRHADLVVDVKKIPELARLDYDAQRGLSLGAAVPCYRIYGDSAIADAYPALTDAARIIGGWQIQSRASIGGNLCNASPAADSIPALFVHRAQCHIAGPRGNRELDVREFCTGPGTHALKEGELLVRISLEAPPPGSSSAYERFIPRNEMDIAVVGVASWVRFSNDGKKIEEARVALAAVGPTPIMADEASQWLAGQPVQESTFERAGELARNAAHPISDMRGTAEYRRHLVGVLVKRTLVQAMERARARS